MNSLKYMWKCEDGPLMLITTTLCYLALNVCFSLMYESILIGVLIASGVTIGLFIAAYISLLPFLKSVGLK